MLEMQELTGWYCIILQYGSNKSEIRMSGLTVQRVLSGE